jgi:hypothetical protein
MSELKQYTLDEVSKHTTAESCWLIIGNEKNGELKACIIETPCVCVRERERDKKRSREKDRLCARDRD